MSGLYSDISKEFLRILVQNAKNSFKAFAYEKLSIGAVASSLTVPSGTKYAEIRLESSVTSSVPVRYLLTGVAPTTTDGMALNNLDLFDITDYQNIINFKAIQTTAGTHTLHVTYYK